MPKRDTLRHIRHTIRTQMNGHGKTLRLTVDKVRSGIIVQFPEQVVKGVRFPESSFRGKNPRDVIRPAVEFLKVFVSNHHRSFVG